MTKRFPAPRWLLQTQDRVGSDSLPLTQEATLNSRERCASRGVQYYTVFKTIHSVKHAPEERLVRARKSRHMEQIRASIGRCLRDKYDTSQPLPKRLADLVRKIKQSAGKSQAQRIEAFCLTPSMQRRRALFREGRQDAGTAIMLARRRCRVRTNVCRAKRTSD
jgi:hypothetical protein